jgi:hypothetical protein
MPRNPALKFEILIIVILACVPLFIHLPYRVNIFLSWEGAYRISQGQLPFRDFGLPLGGMYWMVPALFFKLFGPGLFTLVKAQVFINIVAGLAFRSILVSLGVDSRIRLAAVVLFALSYSFFNFWPWYNHTVIVYELVALACLFRGLRVQWADADGRRENTGKGYSWLWIAGAAGFTICSFLTKQDGGGMAFFIEVMILLVNGILWRRWQALIVFVSGSAVFAILVILPYLPYGFSYWFNHGQPPHTARISAFDIASEFFGSSLWIKFYIFLTLFLAVIRWRNLAALKADPKGVMMVVLTIGILGEAAVLQVTSYTPPDNNIFFHSFAFPCILSLLAGWLPAAWGRRGVTLVLVCGVLLWWSGVWWKYTQRLTGPFLSGLSPVSPTGENVVNKDTYMIDPDSFHRFKEIPTEQWVECGLPVFRGITMPVPTAEGIRRLLASRPVMTYRQQRKAGIAGDFRVLNMSELTPLAAEIPFTPERNPDLPLWYHLGVGMFNRQAGIFETRIREHYYDLVLFEFIPTLNNFYPFRVRDSLMLHYPLVDSFPAPRRGIETQGIIEVYARPAGPGSSY